MCWGSLLWFAVAVLAWDVELKSDHREMAYLRSFPNMAVILMINIFLSLALAAIIFRSGDVCIDFFYSTAISHVVSLLCFCFPLNTTHAWRQSYRRLTSRPLSAMIWVFATLQAVITGFQIYWLAEKHLALTWFLTACALTSKTASHFAATFLTTAASHVGNGGDGGGDGDDGGSDDELRMPVAGNFAEAVGGAEQRVPLLCEETRNDARDGFDDEEKVLDEEEGWGEEAQTRVPTCELNSPLAAAMMEEVEVTNEQKYGMRIKWRRASLVMGALCMGLGAIK